MSFPGNTLNRYSHLIAVLSLQEKQASCGCLFTMLFPICLLPTTTAKSTKQQSIITGFPEGNHTERVGVGADNAQEV